MSHKPKRMLKGLVAAVLALVASVALAAPAMAAEVPAGSLKFSTDTPSSGDPATVVKVSDQAVTISGGYADLIVTQGPLTDVTNDITSITIESTFAGSIAFQNVKLNPIAISLGSEGLGCELSFEGCDLTNSASGSVVAVSSGAINSTVSFLGGNTLKNTYTTGTNGYCVSYSGTSTLTNINEITFEGTNAITADGGSAIMVTPAAAGVVNISNSGSLNVTGGDNASPSTAAFAVASSGQVNLENSGTMTVQGNATNATGQTGAEGASIANGSIVTITGNGSLTFIGGVANDGAGAGGSAAGAGISNNGTLNIGTKNASASVVAYGGNGASGTGATGAAGLELGDTGTPELNIASGSVFDAFGGNGAVTSGNTVVAAAPGISYTDDAANINTAGSLSATGGNGGSQNPATANVSGGSGGGGINPADVNNDGLVLTITAGTVNLNGGMPGKDGSSIASGSTAATMGTALVLGNVGALNMSNGTGVSGSGPELTAVGAAAVGGTGIASLTPAAAIPTTGLNPGTAGSDTFYPWLFQYSENTDGSDSVVAGFAGYTTGPIARSADWSYINIAPHPLTSLSVGVEKVAAGGSTTPATYVMAETTEPTIPMRAENQYELAVLPVFEGVDATVSPISGGKVSSGAITPSTDIVWISNEGGTFYVPANASGDYLTLSGEGALPAGSTLLKLYPNLDTAENTQVPIVYTVTFGIDSAQGHFDTNAPTYSCYAVTGKLVAIAGPVSATNPAISAPELWPGGSTSATGNQLVITNSFIGWFDETGTTPEVFVTTDAVYNSNLTLTAETGTIEVNKIAPSPSQIKQGQNVDITATYTVEPVNDEITAASYGEGGVPTIWDCGYVMPGTTADKPQLSDGAANGMTLTNEASTTSAGTETGTFVVNASVTANANATASIGSFRVWPTVDGQDLNVADKTTVAPYAVVTVAKGDAPAPSQGITVYRLLNPFTGAHLITADVNEWDTLSDIGWNDEGVAFYAAETGVPVYRLFNPNNGDHMYTTSLDEYDRLGTAGWDQEDVVFYGSLNSSYPIYRLWNQMQTANGGLGSHLWTADFNEYRTLPTIPPVGAWVQEGQAWFAAALPPATN